MSSISVLQNMRAAASIGTAAAPAQVLSDALRLERKQIALPYLPGSNDHWLRVGVCTAAVRSGFCCGSTA